MSKWFERDDDPKEDEGSLENDILQAMGGDEGTLEDDILQAMGEDEGTLEDDILAEMDK